MSLSTIGTRLDELQTMVAQMNAPATPGRPAATAPTSSFAGALAAAQTSPSAAPVSGTGASSAFDAQINAAAASNGIDPALLKGLVSQESGFNPNARSGAGAVGLTQLMPGTAASLGVTNPLDPAQSLQGGAKYLRAAARPLRRRREARPGRLQRRPRRRAEVRRRPALRRDPELRHQRDEQGRRVPGGTA